MTPACGVNPLVRAQTEAAATDIYRLIYDLGNDLHLIPETMCLFDVIFRTYLTKLLLFSKAEVKPALQDLELSALVSLRLAMKHQDD